MKNVRKSMIKRCLFWLCLLLPAVWVMPVKAEKEDQDLLRIYEEYRERFEAVRSIWELDSCGYEVLSGQSFPVKLESFGGEEMTLVPAIERTFHRLVLFFADSKGNVLYKYDQLETNNCIPGQLEQPVESLLSVAFADVNHDQKTDIILITRCVNTSGDYAGIPYKVGDVLFQGDKSFYRDWRISDKINRFSMNKSANYVISFVRDGESVEFLYTAKTLDELLEHGFQIAEDQHYTRDFEKLGRLQVVPGTVKISAYNIFMIYLVNGQGDIVWSFQPMGDYDSLYSLRGIQGRDLDGDGMKDLVVLARYSIEIRDGESQIENRCAIYYQRTGGFDIDTEFETYYQCKEEDTMEELIKKIREYWGWQAEE